jgi:lipopolysaccharide biosynthesis regulator YciM
MNSGELLGVALAVLAAIVGFGWYLRRAAAGKTPEISPEVYYARALDCLIAGDRAGAMGFLKRVVQADSHNVDAYVRLGNLLRDGGEVEKALQIHRDLTVRAVDDADVQEKIYESLTEDYIACGRHREAVAAAEKLRAINRKNAYALRALNRVYEQMREWDKAYEAAEELERLNPSGRARNLARYKAYIGADCLQRGKVKDARRHFEEALRLDETARSALVHLGDVEYEEGDPEKAVSLWKKLIDAHPASAYIVFDRLERAYFDMGRFSEMVQVYEEILAAHPREVRTLLALAGIQHKKGDLDEALRIVREAVEIEPENARARRHLARLRYECGDVEAGYRELLAATGSLEARSESFACSECGYRSEDVFWRCPKCRAWETCFAH